MKGQNICAVTAHARVRVGEYTDSNRMSLYHRAKMDTRRPSQAFFDSVTKVESSTIPGFNEEDTGRLLNLTQLTDTVVYPSLMQIKGAETHRSVTFGHSGGYLAHLIVD